MANRNFFVRWGKYVLKTIGIVILFFILLCFLFDQLVQFRMSDEKLLQLFREKNVRGEVRYFSTHGRTIRYVSVGNDSLPVLFFIHGSPSSLSIYNSYLTDTAFARMFRMYAVDRPGYGYSGFGHPEPSIERQAQMLYPILDSLNTLHRPVIIVGGSYGTSIACRMVMDHPGVADGLVLTGPALAPGQEKVYWFSRLIEKPYIRWFIPRMFRSANTEKLHHEEELRKMLPYWNRINIPVTYLQGEKDQLIYTTNAAFAKKQMVNAPFLNIQFLKGRPHFFAFTEHATIRTRILDMYNRLKHQ